jgi:hypothetical protein
MPFLSKTTEPWSNLKEFGVVITVNLVQVFLVIFRPAFMDTFQIQTLTIEALGLGVG